MADNSVIAAAIDGLADTAIKRTSEGKWAYPSADVREEFLDKLTPQAREYIIRDLPDYERDETLATVSVEDIPPRAVAALGALAEALGGTVRTYLGLSIKRPKTEEELATAAAKQVLYKAYTRKVEQLNGTSH